MNIRRALTSISLIALFVFLLIPAGIASADAPTCAVSQPPPPGMSLSPTSGPLGTTIHITNSVTISDANIYIWYRDSGQLLHSETHVQVTGTTGYDYYLDPVAFASAPLGTYDFVILDNMAEESYCVSFTLTAGVQQDAYSSQAAAGITHLPETGLTLLLPLAGAAACAGTGLLVRRRTK